MVIYSVQPSSNGGDPDPRTPITPDTVKKLIGLGATVQLPSGIGLHSGYQDEAFASAGAEFVTDPAAAHTNADIVLGVELPRAADLEKMRKDAIYIGRLDPFFNKDLVESSAKAGVQAISMEMIPRTTIAQKMDVISSQANLAGYYAVILATERLNKIVPMMMTPAGTIAPARVFIIGVGVAGLQAIATAKRLGARVEAFDTRPVVEEQVKSLGAKFVKIDLGETGQTDQGYAKALTPEQLEMQRAGMAKVCAQSDIVITTAKLFGRKAPTLITADMIAGMQPGSIIVDLAAETGGNVIGTEVDQEVMTENGVRIIGIGKLENNVPKHASQVYASNLANFIEHFWDKETNRLNLDLEDEIISGCLLTQNGEIIHPQFKETK